MGTALALGPRSYPQLLFLTPTPTPPHLSGKTPSAHGDLGVVRFSWCCQPHRCPARGQGRKSAVLTLFETVLPVHLGAEQLRRVPIAAFHTRFPF